MRQARADCDLVVVSLFVNPAQFAPGEDLDAYPRDEQRDAALAADAGRRRAVRAAARGGLPGRLLDRRSTSAALTEVLAARPSGAAPSTSTASRPSSRSCFNMVGPDVAYFGQKDAQQALVVASSCATWTSRSRSRSARSCATRRPGAELAQRLPLPRRARACARPLTRAARRRRARRRAANTTPPRCSPPRASELDAAGVEPEYLELRSTDTLQPVERVNGSTLLAVAARVGRARLIDNAILGGAE